jgi:hypothetical protein
MAIQIEESNTSKKDDFEDSFLKVAEFEIDDLEPEPVNIQDLILDNDNAG